MARNDNDDDGAWETFKKKFPKGAKVQLNAGGPIMSVKDHHEPNVFGTRVANEHTILCQWFSGKKLESGYFAPETLTLVKDDAGKK